ncbi:MAG: glycosyltransferase [Candidatus Latescibacteria bacterium]|nr:glycosyltransferase [Candidatus Latescibacterota bacterium]
MEALAFVSSLLCLVYVVVAGAIHRGLSRLSAGASADTPDVTVVIPARNEAHRIDGCLSAIAEQTYPPERTRVIVVDDHSTDDTARLAIAWADRIPGLRVVQATDGPHACPKKNALDTGIRAGAGEIILTTDADCIPSSGWIASMVRAFEPDVGMVAGYAPLIPKRGALSGLLALQGLVVSTLAAGSIGLGLPLTCSGRNLAYRKSAFHDAGGFDPIGHIRGGDDVLLMRRLAALKSWRIRFNPEARVDSHPHTDGLFRRQVRYQSKAVHYGYSVLLAAACIYIFHVVLAAAPFLAWQHPEFRFPFGLIAAAKILADWLLLSGAARRFKERKNLRLFPLLELISVPYVVVICAAGVLTRSRWK